MNIPQGYKQTELGIIPEDWEVVELEQGLNFRVGFPFVSDYFNVDAIGLRLVRNRDLKSDDQIIYYSGKYKTEYIVRNGDVLVSMDGDFLPCVWQKGVALLNQRVGRIISRTNWNEVFLFYLLFEPLLHKQEETGATTVKHLSHNDIEQMRLPIPPPMEQNAIAEALSDVDALIAALDKKIAKKRLIKQGAMQQLLTGKKRLQGLCGDIQKVALLELGRFVSGNRFPLRYQGNSVGDYPFYKVSDFNTKSNENYLNISNNYVTKDTANNLKCNIIPKNSIVFAKIGAAIFLERKKICLADCCIDNNMMSFIPNKNFDTLFIYYFLRTISFGELVETTALPSLGVKTLGEIIVNIPPTIEEQKAIAKSLSDMDKEIVDLEARRDKYKLIKNGMMQKLLTGQIRLK